MRVVIADLLAYSDAFVAAFRARMPDVDFAVWPELRRGSDYELLVAWLLPADFQSAPPSLRAIFCFGSGTDGLLGDPRIPGHIPVVRLRDEGQADQLLDYALYAAFARLNDDFAARRDQAAAHWRCAARPNLSRASLSIAVLGLGPLGAHVAQGLAAAGFPVRAWSRSPRDLPGVRCLHGPAGLGDCVDGADLLINLLPSRPETRDILTTSLFYRLAPGACLVNLGRGDHLDEDALREALRSGRLGGAFLDVFRSEPLPATHWFWRHERVRLTPHRAGLPTPRGAAASVAAVVDALKAGQALPGLVRGGSAEKYA
ncbi:MAG: glyoxylate/hydroxypyruvate reductase A [Rhizobiaceae bacterium]|nr:glyoxylate/hydroxypyruvate reductase A [Rhizobiaceae bacterium]